MKLDTKFAQLVFAALLAITGCTNVSSPRQTHEPAKVESSDVDTSTRQETSAASVSSEDLEVFAEDFKILLSRERLEHQLRQQNRDVRQQLYLSIETASRFVETMKASPERSGLIDTFMTAVKSGCSETLTGCRFLSLFRKQAGSVTLALAAAEVADQPGDRLKALSLAFALVGDVDDPRLANSYLRSTPKIESMASAPEFMLQKSRHREIVEHSLIQIRKSVELAKTENRGLDLESAKVLKQLASSWDIYNFGRTRSIENASRERLLFSMVSTHILEPSELSRQIQLAQSHENAVTKKISRTASPALKAFGIAPAMENDFHLFLFDSLWLGRISTDEADILWIDYLSQQSAEKSTALRAEAQKALLNYFKTRLLTTSRDVNSIIVDFFKKKDQFITANAFQDGLNQTGRGSTLWAEARRRLETLQNFNERHLRASDNQGATTKDLEFFMASLDRNIKVLSTYPSMLVMAYNFARLGFSIKVETWTGSFEIKSGEILDWFFSGILSPWMSYSKDTRSLLRSEISQVFFYALEMGVLTESGVDIEELFKILTEQMVGPLRADVQKIDDSFRTNFDENTAALEFRRLCELAKVRGKQSDGAPQIPLRSLRYFTISGLPQGGLSDELHSTFQAAWSFFDNDQMGTLHRLDENLEIIRLEFTPKIDHLNHLARMVDDYGKRHAAVDNSKTTENIKQRIGALESVRKKAYTRIFRLTKATTPCGEQAVDNELASQVHAIEGLVAHFKLVHAHMKSLRNASSSEAFDARFGFSKKVAMSGLDRHEALLGFNKDMYRVSRLQILLRVAEILESGYVDGGKHAAPRRNKGSITIPSRLQDVGRELLEKPLRLDWAESADEFATQGMQLLFDDSASFMRWLRINVPVLKFKERIRAMAALARAGSVDTDLGPQRMDPKEVARISLKTAKWIEVENSIWVDVLNVTGEYRRLSMDAILNNYVREEKNHNWMGMLDHTFNRFTDDKLGEGDDDSEGNAARYNRRLGAMAQYRLHIYTIRAMSRPTLDIPATTMADMTNLYKGSLDQQLDLVAEFLDEARRLEALRKSQPEAFPSWRINSLRKSPEIPILTVSSVELFRSMLFEYRRKTGYEIPPRVEQALKAH